MREEIRDELGPFREEVRGKFNEMQNNFDNLFTRDEKREHENVLRDEQAARLEMRVVSLEKKVA